MSYMDDMNEERQRAWEAAKEILDRANTEGRDLTAEEEQSFERANERMDKLDARIKANLDLEQRRQDAESALERIRPNMPANERADSTEESERLNMLLRGEARSMEFAFAKRDLTTGTASSGGATVPTGFSGMLMEHLVETATVARVSTVVNTASGENIAWPVTTAHGSATLHTESASITESDPTFASRTLGAYKYATAVQVPRELIEDTGVDLQGYLARQAGRACGNALGTHLATGDGSSKPSGIVTGSTLGETGANSVSGVFDYENLVDLFHAVIGPYRNSPSCGWMMRDASVGQLRKLQDGASHYIYQPAVALGAPDTLFGKPIYTDPNIAATGLSAKSVIFGDLSAYVTRLAGGIRFERSDDYAFDKDQITFRCIVRGDGILADQTGAVKHFIGGSS